MKMRLPLLTAAALACGLAVSATAFAQEPPRGGPPAPPVAGADKPEKHGPPHPRFSAADREAFFEARLAGLHAGLKLTPDQEKLWPPVEAALKSGAKAASDRFEKAHSEPPPTNAIAWLQKMSEEDLAKGASLKALADAAAPLYQSLSDDQKRRLPFLLHGVRPHGFGPWGGHGGPMMHDEHAGGPMMGPDHGDHDHGDHDGDDNGDE
ncbi:Spy/CpxP family protein refolding chaperone [Methylocella silvestris]|uniref:LTXXQ motif family protein n=1 Tax=Methylocella silvestris TaxID=199596 RepID=A0A2J7TJX2_METSI|nr:Spy/CpxP family protein refolding chaperone [Methylocella silvestris]PNG27065.1 hypothetical protein CR492_05040 [Methylocella silvestris]